MKKYAGFFLMAVLGGLISLGGYTLIQKNTGKLQGVPQSTAPVQLASMTGPGIVYPDFTVAANDLLKEFESNEQASNKKYWDKVLSVEGMVKDVTRDDRGFYSVILGDTTSLSSVRCSIDSIHGNEAASVKRGHIVSVKGICSGYNADDMLGSDIILVRSVIGQKK